MMARLTATTIKVKCLFEETKNRNQFKINDMLITLNEIVHDHDGFVYTRSILLNAKYIYNAVEHDECTELQTPFGLYRVNENVKQIKQIVSSKRQKLVENHEQIN
jgi:hypothetical protein